MHGRRIHSRGLLYRYCTSTAPQYRVQYTVLYAVYSLPNHFCCRSLARTSVLLSEVDSDRRAARGS
eukprot:COSAG05_NODE_11174_length_526_cov_73.379391_1_plen_65_part_10